MGVKEEFEKAFLQDLGYDGYTFNEVDRHERWIAFWAAKWMAEYIAKRYEDAGEKADADGIRQIAKELS